MIRGLGGRAGGNLTPSGGSGLTCSRLSLLEEVVPVLEEVVALMVEVVAAFGGGGAVFGRGGVRGRGTSAIAFSEMCHRSV